MRPFKSKLFHSYLSLSISLLLVEIVFRLISNINIVSLSFLRVFIGINILSLIIGYISSLFKGIITYIINFIVVLIATVYSFAQIGFNNYLGVYMSLNTSGQFDAVKDYTMEFIRSFRPYYCLLFIPIVLFIIGIFVIKNLQKKDINLFDLKVKYKYEKVLNHILYAIILAVFTGAFYFTLSDNFEKNSTQVISYKELLLNASNPSLCVKEFGVLSYGILDINSKMNPRENDVFYLTYSSPNDKDDYDRHFDDEAWEELIESENNTIYNNLNKYFINSEITNRNDYTGMFKDKNLIVILMESINDIIYNVDYFPNFKKLASEGWYFENNYSPRNSCATGNNEFSSMTGLYSIYNLCTSNTYMNNTYSESIFNLFNNAGYYTNSAHNYDERYYYRRTIHKNMGSQKYYGIEDLNIPYYNYYGGWSSDVDFINSYLDIMDKSTSSGKPFMSYLSTVTSHQPYSGSSPYGDKYLDMTKDTDYSMEMRRYLSKVKELDNALGVLIDGLKDRDLLDDTVIVLFGDHYPYGMSNETISEVLDRDLDDYEIEKVPFVIYNPELTSKVYDTYTSYINLTPTLANLFDLDFDPRLYAGSDIFNEDYINTVSFADLSWKNEKAYYNASTGRVTYYDENFKYTPEEIKNMNMYFYNKTNASMMAIKSNYFNYLEENIKRINEEKMSINNEEEIPE